MVAAERDERQIVTKGRLSAAAAATVVAGLVLWVAPAFAIRPATVQEAEAIQEDLGLAGCDWRVGISTVDSAWARIEAEPATCPAVTSLNTKAQFDGTHWIGSPWTLDIQLLCPSGVDIPEVVAGDLGLCVGPAPARELMACDNRRTLTVVYRPEPRSCPITARSDAYGEVVNLRALHWRGWGDRTAWGWGAEVKEPVSIRAWRLRPICGDASGARAYTRLRISSDRGVLTVQRNAC
jgi:hypothetical protein